MDAVAPEVTSNPWGRMNEFMGMSSDPRGTIISYVEKPITIALLIIAALGLTILSPAIAGFTVAGLAGAKYLVSLIGRDFEKGKDALTLDTMFTTAVVVFGILGGLGIVSASIACWIAFIPSALILGGVALGICCCLPCAAIGLTAVAANSGD